MMDIKRLFVQEFMKIAARKKEEALELAPIKIFWFNLKSL